MTQLDYYDDSSQYGNYQFVKLDELINNYLMSRDTDDFTSTTDRYKILYQAKRGVRELYYDVLNQVKAIELDLSPTLNVVLPPDFVNFVRISWVGDDGQLHPLAMDNRMTVAQVYLQDNNFELLFDNEGNVLEGSKRKNLVADREDESLVCYNVCHDTFLPNKNTSNVYTNGKFKIDNSTGTIQFGSDAEGKAIVLEYISDGLYSDTSSDDGIKIHKFAESALLDFIYYELVKNRRNVPANEKMRARKEFYNSKRIAKRRIHTLNIADIKQVFKGDTKWIK